MPGSLDERVVFPFNRFDTLRAFDDREVRLPRDPRDFPQHVPPIRDQVEHMIRRGDIERSGDEWKSCRVREDNIDRKSTRLNSSHLVISYAVFCLKKKKKKSYASPCLAPT